MQTTLEIPIPHSSSPFPSFQRPTLLGSYAQDENREWIVDANPYLKVYDAQYWNLKSLKGKPLDMNRGHVILKDPNFSMKEGINSLLQWLRRNPQPHPPDFVLFRGVLTMLMKTPYEQREPWSYSVVKYKDTIYLRAEETEFARNQKQRMSPFIEKTMKWGYRFEDIMTQNSDLDFDRVLNTNAEYDAVFQSNLDKMSIIYGAEMDAVSDNKKKSFSIDDFIEFKTSKEIYNDRVYQTFVKFKLIKWWIQSFLVGIPTIVCGFRDDDGFIHSIKNYEVKNIPKMKGVSWRPNVCMGFLKNLLYALKQGLIDTPNVVYNVSCEAPGSTIHVYETDLDMSHVLPSWYTT